MWETQRRFVDVIDGRMVGRFRKRETKLRVFVVGLWLEARCLSDSDVQAVVFKRHLRQRRVLDL